MSRQASFRGQPLLLLVAVVTSWSAVRVAAWEHDGQPEIETLQLARSAIAAAPPATGRARPARSPSGQVGRTAGATAEAAAPVLRMELAPARPVEEPGVGAQLPPAPWLDRPVSELPAMQEADAVVKDERIERTPVRRAVGHNLLLAAGLSKMEIPADIVAHLEAADGWANAGLAASGGGASAPTASPAFESLRSLPGEKRWSGDAWLFLRDERGSAQLAGQPAYGRSQAGAVIRFKLVPASSHEPQAFVRATGALRGSEEEEVAAGLSGRPIPALPVRAAVELRATRYADRTDFRPAALAVTELPPLKLPLSARAEAYVAGGYVGGDFATGFVEGQARVERLFAREEDTEFTAGAGAWGGAQKDAARLDIGPTAAVTFRLGETRSRVTVDYRIRVAGDAQPASGAALTLSAGF